MERLREVSVLADEAQSGKALPHNTTEITDRKQDKNKEEDNDNR
jgi:hypothetical protein